MLQLYHCLMFKSHRWKKVICLPCFKAQAKHLFSTFLAMVVSASLIEVGFSIFQMACFPPPTSFWPCPLCSLSFRPILRRTWIWLVDQVSTSQVRISKWPGLGIELGHIFFPFCFICVCLSALHVLEWAALNLNPGQEKATPLILPYALLILFPCSCLGLLTKIKPCLRGIISYLWHM